ncbi:hypothetical protein, partial [Pseudomonas aeruginosa]
MRTLIIGGLRTGFFAFMTTFYTVISWLMVFGYWLLIAGVTMRILMKRRAVPSAMAWLLVIY